MGHANTEVKMQQPDVDLPANWEQRMAPIAAAEKAQDWLSVAALCRQWIKEEDWNPIPYHRLGMALRAQGSVHNASAPLEAACVRMTNLHPAIWGGPDGLAGVFLSTMAEHCIELGKLEDALNHARFLSAKIDPGNLRWAYNRAWLCIKVSKKARERRSVELREEALEQGACIIQQAPHVLDAWVMYCQIVAMLGLAARAHEGVEKLGALDAQAARQLKGEVDRLLDDAILEQTAPRRKLFGIF